MKKKWKILGIVVAAVAILVIPIVSSYNGLVELNEGVNNSFSQVQSVIQRRSDLIPSLVETVKGYASHEQDTLENITKARSQVESASNPEELAEANEELTRSLGGLSVVVEEYPDLKANENFLNLQDELAGTENRISVERQKYNETVQKYNRKIRRFPTNITAKIFNFDKAEYFEADEKAQDAPEVNFD